MNISTNLTFTVPPTEELQADSAEIDILMTIVFFGVAAGVMSILFVGFLNVRRKESKERKMAGVTVVPQQSLHRCPQFYLLMFYTASGRHSGTTANVFCRMYGNHRKSKPLVLRDPERAMFQASSVSSFLVTLSHSLNEIKEIHIWHDISGPRPPWFLEGVVICHLNTNVTWYFEANRWLDVSAGSKEVECRLRPLKRNVYLRAKTLFDAKLDDNLTNEHLWFAPLLSNKIQTFGRSDKIMCGLTVAGITLLLATVLVDSTQSLFTEASVRLGPWKLRVGDVYRATICGVIAFIFRLFLEFLFKNSKRKRTLPNFEMNVNEHIEDYFQRLNAIEFVEGNNDDSCDDHREDERFKENANSEDKPETTKVENDEANQDGESGLVDFSNAVIGNSNENANDLSSTKSCSEAKQEVPCNKGALVEGSIYMVALVKGENLPDDMPKDMKSSSDGFLTDPSLMKAACDDAVADEISDCNANKDKITMSKETKNFMKSQDIRELIDCLGQVPEKETLIEILESDNDVSECEESNAKDNEESPKYNDLSFESDEVHVEVSKPQNDAPDSSTSKQDDMTEISTDSSSKWSKRFSNPDKVPKLWKQLPFPHQLIDEYGIKKLQSVVPRFPYSVLRITRAQCFIVPFLCTIVTIAMGLRWPGSIATSWFMTFVLAFIGQIFILETLYSLLHAIYFATWCQRPVREEDLLNQLSNKVWVNETEELSYFADAVVDDDGDELIPRPPTQEDIQEAQRLAGRDRELEDVVKMLAFDVLFLFLLTLITLGNRDAFSYPSRVGMENTFNITHGFSRQVKNTETFWKWLMNDTIPVLLFDLLDKTPNEGKRHFLTDGYTYLLGTAILRQQRTKPGLSCDFADIPQRILPECHQLFLTKDNEDKTDYYQGWKVAKTSHETGDSSPWKYSSGGESGTDYSSWGRTNSFHGGGYIVHLSSEREAALKQLNSLKASGWIDQLTRVVFLEFSTYNANVNILSALVFSTEFASYGGALPYFDMYSFRLFRYFTTFQFLYLVCEIIFVVFVAQLIDRVGHQIYRDRLCYFTSFWNYTDLLLILFSLVNISFYAVRFIYLSNAIEAIRTNPNAFYGFLSVAFYDELIAYISCIIFLIPCLQFLKFLKFNKNFMIFYVTLERIGSDICGFGFLFLVSLLSFTYWSYTLLKTVAEPFSTFLGTFYSMISLLLGKFSFRLLSPGPAMAAQVGPLFTYSFTCINVFFLLNIILAIITLGFAKAQSDERFQESEYEVVKFIVNYIKERLGLFPPYIPPPPKITPPAKEKHYTYFQWKLCTRYVTRSQFPRLMRFAKSTYLEDFVDELEIVANVLNLKMSRQVLEEMVRREQSSTIFIQ